MERQLLVAALAGCMNPDPQIRIAAEHALQQVPGRGRRRAAGWAAHAGWGSGTGYKNMLVAKT